MRRPSVRFTSWKLLIPLLIAADLLVLWVWSARPARVYSRWLGLVGRPEEAPIRRLVASALEEDAPWTPSGFFSLFEPDELFFAGLLLFPLLVLILIPLATRRSENRLRLLLFSSVRAGRDVALRFRVRTALAAIAILCLYLGWEIHGWRTWRVRSLYLRRAATESRYENEHRSLLQRRRAQLARLIETDPAQLTDLSSPEQGFYRSKASHVADLLVHRERLTRETRSLSAQITAHAERRSKYERAAANPWGAVGARPAIARARTRGGPLASQRRLCARLRRVRRARPHVPGLCRGLFQPGLGPGDLSRRPVPGRQARDRVSHASLRADALAGHRRAQHPGCGIRRGRRFRAGREVAAEGRRAHRRTAICPGWPCPVDTVHG